MYTVLHFYFHIPANHSQNMQLGFLHNVVLCPNIQQAGKLQLNALKLTVCPKAMPTMYRL